MCSKFIALALSFLLFSCSLRVNEEIEKPKVAVNPLQSGCLKDASKMMKRYFDGQAQEEEMDAFWACLEKALKTFSNNTKGGSEDHFMGDELAGFLSKYFLGGRPIEPAFVREVMYLKQGILGGSSEKITRTELDKILQIIRVMRNVSLRLRPHMPIKPEAYLARNYSVDQFENAVSEFQLGLGEIGQALEQSQGTYSFDRLAALLKETKLFLYPEMDGKEMWIDYAIRLTYALRPAKSIFVAPPRDEIRSTDWAKIYYLGPRYYGLYLRAVFYSKSDGKFTHGTGLMHLEKVFSESISLVELALNNQADKSIRSEEIDELILALSQNDLLPVQPNTAKSLLRFFFVRLMEGQPIRNDFVITQATLDRLKETFRFSTEGMRVIEYSFRKKLGSGFSEGSINFDEIAKIPNDELLQATALKSNLSVEAIQAVKFISTKVKTVAQPNSSLVYIPLGRERMKVSQSQLTLLHLLYSFNRLIFRAYSKNPESVSEGNILQASEELFPILEEMGFLNKDTQKSVPKRLFEASLFLYSSDGSTSLTMQEALELESLLLSTIVKGGKIHKSMASLCNATEKDEKGDALISASCYRRAFLRNLQENWSQIPGLYRFFRSRSGSEQQQKFLQIENFLRKDKKNEPYRVSDSNSLVLFPYYVEMLFSRFDLNRDNLFDKEEARSAYLVFKPFLAKKCREQGLTEEEDFYAVYMFLLAYQTLPNDMKATWVWTRYITGSVDFNVDRGEVIQIFDKLLSL